MKSEKQIPKNLIKKCVIELSKIEIKAPIKYGSLVYENILETGANIIATREVEPIDKK